MKFQILLLGIFFLGWGNFLLWENVQKLPNEHIQIHFLQTTRGDSIYIKSPHGKEILIDGGSDRKILSSLKKYRPFWDRYIDMIIISHPDSDHYYGALEVIKRFEVGKIFLTGVIKNDPKYGEIFQLASQKNIEIFFLDSQKDFSVDGIQFDILYPVNSLLGSTKEIGNNSSLIFHLIFDGKKILFTGDIEALAEKKMVELGINLKSDILKVPHHGSKSSSSLEFLDAVHPSMAIMQVGVENNFGHPHQEILDRYAEKNIPVENTREGDIILSW